MNWRRSPLVCGMVFIWCITSHNRGVAQETPSAPHGSVLAHVFLVASGNDNSRVTPAEPDLRVFVDKKPVNVVSLRPAKDVSLQFAVLVDVSKSSARDADSIKKAVSRLFQSLSVGGNEGYLVAFNGRVAMSNEPLHAAQVQAALSNLSFGGGTAVYDAIEETCAQRLSRSGNPGTARRLIVLISDGDDNQSHVRPADAESAAEREGVAIFSLAIGSSTAGSRGEHFLKDASRKTGGEEVTGKNLTEEVQHLLTAIEEQWILSFVSAQAPDQKLHTLSIQSSQKNIRFSAPAHVVFP